MEFDLHPQLEKDCLYVGRFSLSRLILMNDKQFPWFILVPEVSDITEIYQLNKQERRLLMDESSYLAEQLAKLFKADKINIAAIGNLVPQLHVHHVVRYRTDPAWPAPIWGKYPAIPYSQGDKTTLLSLVRENMAFDREEY
ncbi:MAG: HIT family protein [Methylococcaceae bacterium]|nr:HIT family protein [Methylococcaceae bacterium]